jgi:murein DD-endopeptidase MepM/ murein hydrolase activator NlpD
MKRTIGSSLLGLVLLTGCGAGYEPLSILGDPSESIDATPGTTGGTIGLPLTNNSSSGYGISGTKTFIPFTSSSPFITIQNTGFSNATTIVAPSSGIIVDTTSNSITMYHNAHVITKVKNVLNTVQVGTYVTQGQTIGTAINQTLSYYTPAIQFYVFADGYPVCPLSYLNADGRTQLDTAISTGYGYSYGQTPCQ